MCLRTNAKMRHLTLVYVPHSQCSRATIYLSKLFMQALFEPGLVQHQVFYTHRYSVQALIYISVSYTPQCTTQALIYSWVEGINSDKILLGQTFILFREPVQRLTFSIPLQRAMPNFLLHFCGSCFLQQNPSFSLASSQESTQKSNVCLVTYTYM